MSSNFREVASFVWSIRDLIRDEYKRSKHGEIILPFTVLRRLDCVLAHSKDKVLKEHNAYKGKIVKIQNSEIETIKNKLITNHGH